MKTLRTILLISAGYYALHALAFFLANYVGDYMKGLMPEEAWSANPVLAAQSVSYPLMRAVAAYLLIGTAVCLLCAWRLQQLWKWIPAIAALLAIASIAWLIGFIIRMNEATEAMLQTFDQEMPGFRNMPPPFRSFMRVMTEMGNWATAAPVVLPPILILIFWNLGRKRLLRGEGAL